VPLNESSACAQPDPNCGQRRTCMPRARTKRQHLRPQQHSDCCRIARLACQSRYAIAPTGNFRLRSRLMVGLTTMRAQSLSRVSHSFIGVMARAVGYESARRISPRPFASAPSEIGVESPARGCPVFLVGHRRVAPGHRFVAVFSRFCRGSVAGSGVKLMELARLSRRDRRIFASALGEG
jgi:hypothetical protein